MKIRMRCFYSEMYQDCLFFVMVFCEQWEALRTENFQREVMWACERGSFRKCEFELLKCENIMRFFHWIHTHFTAITLLLSFLLLLLPILLCAYVVLSVEGKNMSFTTHTKGKEGIYFIPDKIDFYFISAFLLKHNKGGWGKWEWDGEMRVIVSEEEKQFVTEYHSEKKGRKNVCGVGKK